jgi:uncharacterized glyoxalase superfamily protein PhnB
METPIFTPGVYYKKPLSALAWLEKAFGFEVTLLVQAEEGDEQALHAEMSFNGAGRLIVGGEWADWVRSPSSIGSKNTQSLTVAIASGIDAHCERARNAGAVIVEPPETQFYGARTYRCADPEGHHWTFSEKVQTLTVEQMEQAGGVTIKGSL